MRSANDERALLAGHYFDTAAAEFVCDFFRAFVRHGDSTVGVEAGEVFELLEWQARDVVYPLFGWKRPDGTRRYRTAYISTAKKNGKSTLTAGLALYGLVADGERNPEVYTAAADREQAAIIFRQAHKFVDASPPLARELEIIESRKRIRVRAQHAFFQSLSHESKTKEGISWSLLIFDELHRQPDSKLWDALRYGGAARIQPLLIIITTAGDDLEGICCEQYRYGKAVRDSEIEDLTYYCAVWEAPEGCAIDDVAAHRAANPSIDVTFPASMLLDEAVEAKASPTGENKFRRYKLNQWVNVVGGWLDLSAWDACGVEPIDVEQLAGAECYGGLDLSSKIDLTAWVLVFPKRQEARGKGQEAEAESGSECSYVIKCRFWCPLERVDEAARKGNHRYAAWVRAGLIETTDGAVVDYARVRAQVLADAETYKVQTVAFDPWNAGNLINELSDEGLTAVEVPQNARRLSGPAKLLEALVIGRRIVHGGNPVLRWMASNVRVRVDVNDNILPQKPRKGGPERIDGIAAMINAFSEIERLKVEGPAGMTAGQFIDEFGGIMEL